MKVKLLQIWDLTKSILLYVFKVARQWIKIAVQELIIVLQKLDSIL